MIDHFDAVEDQGILGVAQAEANQAEEIGADLRARLQACSVTSVPD
ncbi:hypothetical protein WDZ92_51230 [Nostoc sp. NIES-2111]